ncbi:protein MGARP-like [Astyanax mexicanus]|uniref:Protein MGARP-like n=1 Tax=Astyanax mexicanus TaxID=7994 RepID=A0A8T2KKM2_ASTMX|nr:protein MGARP-like [Astyanax mexicanus]
MLCRSLCGGLRGGLRAVAGRRTPVPAAALQARHMSFGIPTSGSNLAIMVLGGGSLTAALFYAYKTVHSDSVRYSNRITDIETKLTTPADEPASIAEVMTVNAVSEAVESVESATEAASEASDPGPNLPADVSATEEPAAETVVAIATEPPPEVKEAAEDLVSVAMEAAEATVAPVLEVLDAVKVLSSSVAEMAAASVGDESSSAALAPPIGRAEERRVVLAEEVKLEQVYEDFATSNKEIPHCYQCSDSHSEHAELEASTMPPAGLEDTSHVGHVENEYSPIGLEGAEGPETSPFHNAGLEDTLYGGNVEPEQSIMYPAGREENTAQDDFLEDYTAALESVEETGAEDADEKDTRAM